MSPEGDQVRRRAGAGWALAAGAAYGALFALGRGVLGSDVVERAVRLPGDELSDEAGIVTNHAISIGAPPEAVWPWLTQMGWHRAGWYTPRWVDRLLYPGRWASADHLDEQLVRPLAEGALIPDGPPGTTYFVVAHAQEPTVLVLHSTTHIWPVWEQMFDASNDWIWTFTLTECGPGRTRLHLRTRSRTSPWWLRAVYVATLVPADALMATAMLRGIRRRAETGGPALQPSTPTVRRWGRVA